MKGESHPRALVYSMGQKSFQGESVLAELMFTPDAFVHGVAVDSWRKTADYYIYVFDVFGRSRFLRGLPASHLIKYRLYARYSALSDLHASIVTKLHPYLISSKPKSEVPSFPAKKWLHNDNDLAAKRVVQLNKYFAELFGRFGKVLRFSELVTDVFGPTEASVALAGCDKAVRNRFLNVLTAMLGHMQCVDVHSVPAAGIGQSEPRVVEYSMKPFGDYSALLVGDSMHKSQWKQSVPFDYCSAGHLYRIDVQNLYGPTECWGNVNLLFQFPVMLVLDTTREESCMQVREILRALKKVCESAKGFRPCFVVVGVNCELPGRVVGDSEIAGLLSETLSLSCGGKYYEVNLTTGENMLQALDGLLSLRFADRLPMLSGVGS